MGQRNETRIRKTIACLEVEKPNNTLAHAKHKSENWSNFCGVMTFAIPLVLSGVGLVFSGLVEWKAIYETIAQLALMVMAIAAGFTFHIFASNYRKAAEKLSDDANILKKENLRLIGIIETIKKEQTFLVTFTNQLGVALAKGNKTITELGDLCVSHIYYDTIVRFNHNNELTINLYETKRNRIRMVGHHQDIFHGEPLLLEKYPNGVEVSAQDIKPYFCVQCLKKHDNIFVIPDYTGIVKDFYWPALNKDDIKTKEDCREAGVTYNQYIGLALFPDSCEIYWVKISIPNPAVPAAANVTPAIVAALAVGNNIGTSTVAVAATAPSAAPSKAPSSRSPPVHAAVNVPANAPTTAETPMNTSASISSSPVGSILITGLLLQYANILCPRTPCPVEIYVSALMNRPKVGL